jgi:predicted dehydrogenase
MTMSSWTRRDFLKGTVAVAAGSTILKAAGSARAQPMGANGDIRVAVIGFNSKGRSHIGAFKNMPGVRLVALCDVDPKILDREVAGLKQDNIEVFATNDFRRILDRDDIDAVTIATPNHLHAPLTVWACQAGKDVYVEKPVSHGVWEGRKMVEAATKYNRIVQSGTQTRSDDGAPIAVEYVRSGKLGKIQWIHAVWFKNRGSIGIKSPWYPDWIDYNLFCGPAPEVPLRRNELHYDWHWMWDTGNGDISNLGTHMFDLSRWFAGFPTQPPRVISFGGRYGVHDCGDTPNHQLTILEYPDFPIMIEIRNLPMGRDGRDTEPVRGTRSGVIVQCEGGYYMGYQGGGIYDNEGKRIEQIPGDGGRTHFENFIEGVRSRKMADLRAPIDVGHVSTSSLLMGNISIRCGKPADGAAIRKAIDGNQVALDRLDNLEKHLAEHGIDLAKEPLTLGSRLEFDAKTEKFTGSSHPDMLADANFQLKGVYREPFAIKDEV